MTLKTFITSVGASAFSWQPIRRELLTAAMPWAAYLLVPSLMTPLESSAGEASLLRWMLWVAIASSALSFAIASIKSTLPAVLALIAPLPLYLLGYSTAAAYAPLVACGAIFIYAIGFAFHAGNPIATGLDQAQSRGKRSLIRSFPDGQTSLPD